MVKPGFIWLALCCVLLGTSCVAHRDENPLSRFEYEEPQMGVPFRIVLYAPAKSRADEAAEAAFRRIAELNAIMSDYETDSELNRLAFSSDNGSPAIQVSDDLWRVLVLAQQLSKETAGAFDISVGPAIGLWRKARREKRMPDAQRLKRAREKIGYTNIVLNKEGQTVHLLRRGMRLDLGAIAKGYAADAALELLRQRGLNRALVAASGDLAIGDAPPGEAGWRVEIAGYDLPGGPASKVIHATNKGISTSGDVLQKIEIDGVRYSHIVDPFTGIGMTNHALATVIAPNCTLSDVLATACTILPPETGLALARKYHAEARVIDLQNDVPRVVQSAAFPK
jgi:thiamine biosynthesis lipoprotein